MNEDAYRRLGQDLELLPVAGRKEELVSSWHSFLDDDSRELDGAEIVDASRHAVGKLKHVD